VAAEEAPIQPAPVFEQSPEWTKDLVIYEIATKSFTSPNGPESGTFNSLKEKIPYLADLGITAIWLTGFSLSDPHHFYNIWTQYAVIEPGQLDPTLGTVEQFKSLIDEAHRSGIKIFLDVITHGVMPQSSLTKLHPDWFRGGNWRMIDYDWSGGHTDLDDWWVNLWTDYVTRYGVDGFRLDVDIFRADLWARIRENAFRSGHPIVIFSELNPVIPGVTDFTQFTNTVSDPYTGKLRAPYVNDVPAIYQERFARTDDYDVEIQYADHTKSKGSTTAQQNLLVAFNGFTTDRISHQLSRPLGRSEVELTVRGLSKEPVENIVVRRVSTDTTEDPTRWAYGLRDGEPLSYDSSGSVTNLFLSSFYGYSSSIQLSAHDNGWMGFPTDKSPYAAQGSRAVFGYSFLFTPMIPLFMAGEEFDATFHPLPDLSPDLYGGANPGKGRWLYGGQINWMEFDQREHHSMFEDVKRMLSIRKQESAVLAPEIRGDIKPPLTAIKYQSDVETPVPYMRWNGNTAIVIAANRNTNKDANLVMQIPVGVLGRGSAVEFRVTDLWNGGKPKVYSTEQLANLHVRLKRDHTPRGGLGILKIEALR